MKTKLIAAIITVFILCNVASAQDYDIRIEHYTNLRASHSLQSAIIETAPAGTILQVIGSVNRWLQINRNGNEVWMASWVGHTRVQGSEQTVSQPANNIDNCCFVDRQCNSDQQWTDGYYAFQNNQCAAPTQSQQQTSTQPVSNVPAQVDNCCFVNRQCNTEADWIDGYHAFQNNQCAAPAQSQPQSSAQHASNVSGQIDNCCMVDRQCHSEFDWEQGFYAYLAGECPVSGGARRAAWTSFMPAGVTRLLTNPSRDPFNNCCQMHHNTCHNDNDWERGSRDYRNNQCIRPVPLGTRPSIEGDHPKFTKLVNDALELIRVHAPEWLDYIDLSGAREFRLMPLGGSGGFYNQSWTIGHEWLDYERNDPAWLPDFHYIVGYAGGITHEACHSIKQRTYTQSAGWRNEADCVEAQLAVIEAINPNSPDVGWLRASVADYHSGAARS